jgi:trk system potassium uptake protein TrkH
VVRAYLVYKYFLSEFTRLLHPQAVVPVRIHGVPVQRDVMVNVLNYVGLYLIWILVATLLVTGTGLDWVSSLSAVVSTLGGVGPGMGSVGPFDNYDHLHAVAKWILSLCMLLGRLEFYSVLILLSPAYWRR